MPIEAVELTKQLIQIPTHQEEITQVGFLETLVSRHLPGFTTRRIETTSDGRRPSLIIANDSRPDVILIAHGDTVLPWKQVTEGKDGDGIFSPVAGEISNGRLYGRGAGDNKLGVAAMVSACAEIASLDGQKPKVMGIVTADEEGHLTGIKTVADKLLTPMRVETPTYTPWVLSLNGSKGELGHGCRGCIEIDVDLKGRSGHAAIRLPGEALPVSALLGSAFLAEDLREHLASLPPSELMGLTTVNLAGGQSGTWNEDSITVKANQVPDAFRGKFEFRPTDGVLGEDFINSKTLTKLIRELATKRGLEVLKAETALDVDAWIPDPSGLGWFEDIIKSHTGLSLVPEWPIKDHGYDEAGMAVQALNKGRLPGEKRVTGAIYGTADGRFHSADEYVSLVNIEAQKRILVSTLKSERFNPKRYFRA